LVLKSFITNTGGEIMKIEWELLNNKTLIGKSGEYQINVELGAAFGSPYWSIIKDGVILDECYFHQPTKCELSARVQAEKALKKLIG
jgi:hypothetical protein